MKNLIFPKECKIFKEEDKYNITFLILFILFLNYLDVVTTQVGVFSLGAKETIPTMAKMMDLFGYFWWWVKIVVVGAVCYEMYYIKNKVTITIILSLFLSVVLSNFYTIGKYLLY
jgi:hypothetical protein